MKCAALPRRRPASVLAASVVILALYSLESKAANTLACPSPPGGRITCDGNLEPSCKSGDGVTVEGFCFQLEGHSVRERYADLLSRILGRRVSPEDINAYQQELRRGEISSRGEAVTFRALDLGGDTPEEPEKPLSEPPAPAPEDDSTGWSCEACVLVEGQRLCAASTGDTRDEAARQAGKELLKKMPDPGKAMAPQISCERSKESA